MSWLPDTQEWTVDQLIQRGLKVDEACWMVYDGAPVPEALREATDDQGR